jgi:hypothetical protein
MQGVKRNDANREGVKYAKVFKSFNTKILKIFSASLMS